MRVLLGPKNVPIWTKEVECNNIECGVRLEMCRSDLIYKPVVVDGSLCEDIFFLCPFCQSHIPIEVDDRTLAYLRR
jgi:hypothetical protein